ncbi:hypothetical protein [Acrocarpospora catenulata]|uniref:hypothetical protein n=1 Tax=Acrocarpospora catenulata TaxID=2836182 RepID=UPI001BD94741|nr:hypothetical protein [Acrocarpospora catenulata]
MLRETYKGRKVVIKKGRDWGTVAVHINGVHCWARVCTAEAALAQAKRDIDFVGEEIDGASWGPEWYAPGTYEICDEGHPRAIGGACTHSYCNRETPEDDHV